MPRSTSLLSTSLLSLVIFTFCFWKNVQGVPNLNATSQEAVIAFSGEDALLDCKVDNRQNYTVLWKFLNPDQDLDHGQVLTADQIRVINDPRFSIFHNSEHNVWVLKIGNTKPSDTGIYICEVNSNPKQQIARLLSIIDPESNDTVSRIPISISDVNHNYTECCISEGVPEVCHTFCHFKGLVSGNTPQYIVQSCLSHLPSITQCMADGRNHLPCCKRQNIPLSCSPICVGNFTLTTVTDHFICMNYAAPVLACIAEGIAILPPQPKDVTIEALSSSQLRINWVNPNNGGRINTFQINVTQLHTFDGLGVKEKKVDKLKSKPIPSLYGLQMSFTINGSLNEYIVKDLKTFTMYEIQMLSSNKVGTSLPTNAFRVLTLPPDEELREPTKPPIEPEPTLPNIRKCCEEGGVNLDQCLNSLCDPTQSDEATLSDLMICAPWANVTFKCMSMTSVKNKKEKFIDHSNCCKQRGVSEVCLPLCQGSVKRIDFRHFICLDHMSAYSNCILEYHQVLSSEPRDFAISNVHHDWAIVKWKPPKKLAYSVIKYHVHWREAADDSADIYNVAVSKRSPHLLDGLKPGERYEAFVTAVNNYGVSQASVRIIFSTPPIESIADVELEESNTGYNETACCVRSSLPSNCMPLCSYKVKVEDVIRLSSHCANSLPTLVRCAAGGRNHINCCRKRDVSEGCLNVCAGLIDTSPFVIATRCSSDFGRIIQCMEEQSGLLPGMPLALHAELVTQNSVHLQWKPAVEDKEATLITYQVRYGITKSSLPLHPLDHSNVINSTITKAIINGLEPNSRYSIYVTAHNMYGVSLPSLILMVTTLDQNQNPKSQVIHATLGPPHSLEILHQNVDSITFKWLPPLYVPTDSTISYIVFYKIINGTAAVSHPSKENWSSSDTIYTTKILTNLTYNTEYAIAIQAKTDKNETSPMSEVVLVWTDPAIPTAVQLPVIIPAGPVVEGANITAMCIAIGTPVPMLSMFINGHLMAKQEVRHLAFSIINANRSLTSISCYASNGIGKESAQSSLEVRVRFKPSVTGISQSPSASLYGPARIMCQVSSNPQPKVTWYKHDPLDTVPIVESDNINSIVVPHSDITSTWIYTLLIKRTMKYDDGNYICSAENEYGKGTATINLQVKAQNIGNRNTTECCIRQGISNDCIGVCSLDIDIEAALSRPECFGELDKLMTCAADFLTLRAAKNDGSDHRQCCRRRQVPTACLRWCAGLRVNIPSLCILSSAKDIISCFQEGKALLPGPPINVHVQKFINQNRVMVKWNPPEKNSELVQWYRVFWRPVGSRDLMRNQTENEFFELQDLEPEKMYEFVVKSGNHYGLSVFTDPLVVTLKGSHVSSKSLGNKLLSVMLSIGFGFILIIIGIGAVIYYYKHHYKPNNPQSRGVSFENPTYLKDTNTIQIQDSRISSDNEFVNNRKVENHE